MRNDSWPKRSRNKKSLTFDMATVVYLGHKYKGPDFTQVTSRQLWIDALQRQSITHGGLGSL